MTSFHREKLSGWSQNGDDELREVTNVACSKKMVNCGLRISEGKCCPELKNNENGGLGHFDIYQAVQEKETNNNRSARHSDNELHNHKCEFLTPSFAQSDALLNNVSIKDIYDGSPGQYTTTYPVVRGCPAKHQGTAAAADKRHNFAMAKTLSTDSCSTSVESNDRNPNCDSRLKNHLDSVKPFVELLSCSGESPRRNASNKSCSSNASVTDNNVATPPSCFNEHFGDSIEDNKDIQSEHNSAPCDNPSSKVCFALDSPSTSEDVWESLQENNNLSQDIEKKSIVARQTPYASLTTSSTEDTRSDTFTVLKREAANRNVPGSSLREAANRNVPGSSLREAELSKVKPTLTMRISRSLGTFFQKSPSKPSALVEMIDFQETCPEPNYVNVPVPVKEPKRPTSLAGRVVTSISKLGRKGLFKGASTETADDDDDEEFFNNNKYTPVFVLPENQVDVVDKDPVPLTPEQGKLLRDSWIVIKKHVTEVGVETFIGLFNTHPESIDSFLAFKDKSVQDLERSAVLKAHALRVMQTVDKCITRLDRPERMAALLWQLGKRHVDYQANIKLIPLIGKQFIGAIEPKMGPAWTYELKASWTGLFNIINYNMRQGLMEEKNKRILAARDVESTRKKSEEKKKRDRK